MAINLRTVFPVEVKNEESDCKKSKEGWWCFLRQHFSCWLWNQESTIWVSVLGLCVPIRRIRMGMTTPTVSAHVQPPVGEMSILAHIVKLQFDNSSSLLMSSRSASVCLYLEHPTWSTKTRPGMHVPYHIFSLYTVATHKIALLTPHPGTVVNALSRGVIYFFIALILYLENWLGSFWWKVSQ